ncbi:MAG: serine/threonine protein kinase [Gemmatimonadota bacterium]|nr:serine/threonine protein kinase [Gemmatimonadota bacterium]
MSDSSAPTALTAALAGQYEIELELGRGGMGIVYRARDLKLDRPVAIKVLPPHVTVVPGIRDRFLREARTAARLSHPNIVPVYRADEVDGIAFFAMGLVEGESLGERVRARGPLAPAEVVPILCDVTRALGYAHSRGVVHRDVKPENILIDGETGRALVTDFGIARLADASPLTATGQVLGTVHFMSPEQVTGEAIDGRSDLYSLGVVGFHALSARYPFDSDNASAVLVAHVTKSAPPLASVRPELPAALARVIDICLAKDPGARYQSGEELALALEAALASGSAEPPLLREDAARALWARAAELQAAVTGAITPPPRDQLRGRGAASSPTNAYRYGDVRAAALEAGIGERYVARAAADLGIMPAAGAADRRPAEDAASGTAAGVAVVIEDRSPEPNPFAGAPMSLQLEMRVPGELPESDLEAIVELIRQEMQDSGHASVLGRSLTWSASRDQRPTEVSIVPRRGETTIRVTERFSKLAGELFGGIMGGGGGGVGGAAIGVTVQTFQSAPITIAIVGTIVASAYGLARGIFTGIVRRRQRRYRRLLERLAAEVSRSVAAHSLAGVPPQGGRLLQSRAPHA